MQYSKIIEEYIGEGVYKRLAFANQRHYNFTISDWLQCELALKVDIQQLEQAA